jgi:hypothetical protein
MDIPLKNIANRIIIHYTTMSKAMRAIEKMIFQDVAPIFLLEAVQEIPF